MNPSNTEDMEVVSRVLSGEKQAYASIMDKYQSRVMAIVSRYISDQDTAQDVAQEAFIKAYLGLEKFRGDSKFYTWLFQITVNTTKNHLVASTRVAGYRNGVDISEVTHSSNPDELCDLGDPERYLTKSEVETAMYSAIDSLSEDLKEAISLREFSGYSYDDIAKITNAPVGTIKSRISRARNAVCADLQTVAMCIN